MHFHKNQIRELKKGLCLRKYDLMDRLRNDKYETFEEKDKIISAINTDIFLLECLNDWNRKLGNINGPVSYFIEKFDVSRKFAEKYIASKDERVVAMSSDIFDLDGELRIGCIELPVSIMHICEDGTIENYEYNGDKE